MTSPEDKIQVVVNMALPIETAYFFAGLRGLLRRVPRSIFTNENRLIAALNGLWPYNLSSF
jgi:hypothetical protein